MWIDRHIHYSLHFSTAFFNVVSLPPNSLSLQPKSPLRFHRVWKQRAYSSSCTITLRFDEKLIHHREPTIDGLAFRCLWDGRYLHLSSARDDESTFCRFEELLCTKWIDSLSSCMTKPQGVFHLDKESGGRERNKSKEDKWKFRWQENVRKKYKPYRGKYNFPKFKLGEIWVFETMVGKWNKILFVF